MVVSEGVMSSSLTGKGVDIDEYKMTTVDLKELGYRDKPFALAKDVTQVFYVQDMSGDVEEEDDEFVPPPNHQQHVPVRILKLYAW